jgi:BASS family bile acid:Na+ symporter
MSNFIAAGRPNNRTVEFLAHHLPQIVNAAIATLVFALGLNALPADAAFLWHQPGLLLRSLVAIDVVVPLAAILLVLAMRPGATAAIGVLAMAICPGAPFAPAKELKLGGRLPYVYSLLMTVALLTVVTIPLSLQALGWFFASDRELWVAPRQIAQIAVLMLALPLLAGMLLRKLAPGLAGRLARPLSLAANILVLLIVVPILIKAFPVILALDRMVFGLIALLTFVSLAGGHLLGGPRADDRTALAVASSVRHPGLAMLICKAQFPDEPAVAVVLAYVLVAIVASIPYTVWCKRTRIGVRSPE